jgi:hypothetical protein
MEPQKESKIDVCVECCVRERDLSQKKVYRCELCDRWFCEKHIEPRLAFIRDLEAIDNIPEIRVLYFTEIKEKKQKEGHPDFEYSRRKFRELDIEEKRRNELIKQALDRMNHYYAEVDISEEPIEALRARSKRVAMLLKEEEEMDKPQTANLLKFPEGVETVRTAYGFVVPLEVYSNPEYREYLDHANNLKSVKVIVDEYYRKYGKRKKLEEPEKKKHW